jgi:SAM-dependent methyltransferase
MSLQNALLRYMEYSFKRTIAQVYNSPGWLLEPQAGAILLDCGCNNGLYSRRLAEILGATRVYGLELNRGMAREAAANGVHVLRNDVNCAIPLHSDSVHVVTAFNILEHLVETQRFLEEIYRVIRPGGYAIINTPNLASWHNIAALLLGLQPFSGPNITSMTESDVPIVRRMHRRAYDLPEDAEHLVSEEPERHRHIVVVAFRSLIRALQHTGFVVEQALGYGYYPLPPLLARFASRLDPAHAHHMVIKARKPIEFIR